ncbi:MAG: ribose 5-phosphate isomerase B [Chloroflexi bacterium]|nr:ribose 5-phosphate isomerase B [Chloroflexota bacterium]
MKRIAIGCDHRGLTLKKLIMPFLQNAGHSYQDFGCYSTDPVDYPDIAQKVSQAVASGNFDQGILICNTGIGMSIAANKLRGIRAALCCDAFAAQCARQHNDANVLCLKGEDIDTESALEIVKTFLATDFAGGRHARRVNKIKALEIEDN